MSTEAASIGHKRWCSQKPERGREMRVKACDAASRDPVAETRDPESSATFRWKHIYVYLSKLDVYLAG